MDARSERLIQTHLSWLSVSLNIVCLISHKQRVLCQEKERGKNDEGNNMFFSFWLLTVFFCKKSFTIKIIGDWRLRVRILALAKIFHCGIFAKIDPSFKICLHNINSCEGCIVWLHTCKRWNISSKNHLGGVKEFVSRSMLLWKHILTLKMSSQRDTTGVLVKKLTSRSHCIVR